MALKQQPSITLRRTAGEVKRYRTYKKVLPIIILILLTILIIGYVLSALYALTLSDEMEFVSNASRLNAQISQAVTNIDGSTLPDYLDNIDGEHNGDNYIAYTFYCKNAGRSQFDYTYDLYIANMTLDIEKAVRVRLYVNGDYVDYAYARTDGGEGPEPGTTAFTSKTTIVKNTVKDFSPGSKTKFTIVVWLEGNDPDCTDKILGGQFKIDMAIDILQDSVIDFFDSTKES